MMSGVTKKLRAATRVTCARALVRSLSCVIYNHLRVEYQFSVVNGSRWLPSRKILCEGVYSTGTVVPNFEYAYTCQYRYVATRPVQVGWCANDMSRIQ